ncbi:MAG TPA: GNAT family N-acetyltransferase [Solirubrobacteraceae bacterium]|nr:GNAT family N-acetyltransferase [Solirubrobacteraceae bacterium]
MRTLGASVRAHTATAQDIPAATAAVRELLIELGGDPPPQVAMERAARALLANTDAGTLIVAEVDGALAGVLAASWQLALHAAGRYALIQDLWVDPEWRGEGAGRELLAALYRRVGELGMTRVEVGLPRESYPALAATKAFYAANGFRPLGIRMRRGLG